MTEDLTDFKEKINRINLTRKLDNMQKKLDEIYEKEGLTDEVIELQVGINQLRNKENIPDTNENIYKHFVQ